MFTIFVRNIFSVLIILYRAPLYYNFETEKLEPNHRVPREGRSVRITDPNREFIILGRKRIRSGKFRIQYKKSDYEDQLSHAFKLYSLAIDTLEEVTYFKAKLHFKKALNLTNILRKSNR